jgi:hypothetical protein
MGAYYGDYVHFVRLSVIVLVSANNHLSDFNRSRYWNSFTTVLSKRKIYENYLRVSHTLRKGANEFIRVICIFIERFACNSV